MNTTLNEVIFPLLFKAAVTLLAVILTAVANNLHKRIRDQRVADAFAFITGLTAQAVRAVADHVREMKDPHKPGSWTPEQRLAVRDAVVTRVRLRGGPALEVIQRELAGGNAAELKSLLRELTEAQVEELRRSPVLTADALVVNTTSSAPPPPPSSPVKAPSGPVPGAGAVLPALLLVGAFLGLLGPVQGCAPGLPPGPAVEVPAAPVGPDLAAPVLRMPAALPPVFVWADPAWSADRDTVTAAVRALEALGVQVAADARGADVTVSPMTAGPGCFVAVVAWAPDAVRVDPACTRDPLSLALAVQHGVGRAMGLGTVCAEEGEAADCSPVGYGPSLMGLRVLRVGPAAGVLTGAPPVQGVTALDVREARRVRAEGGV